MSEPLASTSASLPTGAVSPSAMVPVAPHSSGTHPPAASHSNSLEEVHASVAVPQASAGFWRTWMAFMGPAILVSVGYMDPGNWATDLEAGARFRYGLLWVVAASSLMAIVLQICAARLGVVTGKDLAQACRDYLPAWTRWPNWLVTEVAIAACDLAEVVGSAVAIHLLFPKISLLLAVCITAADVLLLLTLQGMGMRKIEAFIFALVATIAGCYFFEIFVLPKTKPSFTEIGGALASPGFREAGMISIAIGIVGATVMPHNLYLHSALVQTRRFQKDEASVRRAIKFNAIDSVVALSLAFLVNAAILVLAAITFYGKDSVTLADGKVVEFGRDWIQEAYLTLAPLLGTGLASTLFAVSLLASGQSSTVTGTLAGQVVMEGFMHWRIRPWVRRLITRLVAIGPAIVMIAMKGDESATDLLVLSQVILGIQLPFAMIPLLYFTGSKRVMGKFRNPWFFLVAGWTCCGLITALDLFGLGEMIWHTIRG